MSKPPMFKDDPINKTVSFKVNDDTLAIIENMTAGAGESRSAFIRGLVWAEAARRKAKKK